MSVYALTTKRDFAPSGGMLAAGLMGLLVLGLLQFFVGGPLLHTVKAYFGVLLFSGYLVYDLQMMMGGDKARQVRCVHRASALSPRLAALCASFQPAARSSVNVCVDVTQVRPDEHVLAALGVFVDLVNLFLNVLQAMASSHRDRD